MTALIAETADSPGTHRFEWNDLDEDARRQSGSGTVGTSGTPRGTPSQERGERPAFVSESAARSETRESARPLRWTELVEKDERAAGRAPTGAQPPEPTPEDLIRDLLDEARREAEAVVADARRQADELREEARREGFGVGEREGQRSFETAAERIEALAAELAGYKTSLFEEARSQVVELALRMVDKVLGPLAESDRAAVVRVVERALELLSERERLTIRVHPDDLQILLDAKPRLLGTFDGIQELTLLQDPAVKPGGCLVQTSTTEIDARLDSQFQEIARSVRTA